VPVVPACGAQQQHQSFQSVSVMADLECDATADLERSDLGSECYLYAAGTMAFHTVRCHPVRSKHPDTESQHSNAIPYAWQMAAMSGVSYSPLQYY